MLFAERQFFTYDFCVNVQKLEIMFQIMQKMLPPHVLAIKNGLVRFLTIPRTFLESLGPKLPHQNLFDGNLVRRTEYFHHLRNVISKNLSILRLLLENP